MRHHRSGGVAQAIILGKAAPAPVFTKGVGEFFASNSALTGVQSTSGVMIGTGNLVPGVNTFANYPNAKVKSSYKIATECEFIGGAVNDANRDLSKSCVMGEEMDLHPTWIAKNPTGGTNLHSFFGDHSSYFPDLGNTGFQAAAAANAIAFCHRWGVTHLYIDNMGGYSADLTFEGVIPSGYSSESQWRHNAAIPFVNSFSAALKAASPAIYVIMSLSDEFDTGLGENVFSMHDGTTRLRFATEIAAAGTIPNAAFWEYFLEGTALPYTKYQTGEDAELHRFDSNQGRIASLHSQGYDFHGMDWHNHASSGTNDIGHYVRAACLLDRREGDMYWLAVDPNDGNNPFTDTDITRDPGGAAIAAKAQVGPLWWRQFPNFTVIINPTTSGSTQTILGVSRTVGALASLYV